MGSRDLVLIWTTSPGLEAVTSASDPQHW